MPVECPQGNVEKATSPETIITLTDEILLRWNQLPPEHQVTMALTFFQNVQEGEWADWLAEAISMFPIKESETEELTFPVYSLNRTNLENAFSEEEITQLGDKGVQRIAKEMSDGFLFDVGFWFAVKMIGERILESEGISPENNSA